MVWGKIKRLLRTIANIPKMIANAINNAIDKMFRVPLNGIMEMIENFRRIICFLESIPLRGRNVTSGVGNIFLGVEKKVAAIGESIQAGMSSTGTLLSYTGEYAGTRLKCIIKFVQNFYKCIFFYVIKAIGGILKTIVLVPTKFFGSMIGLDMDAQFTRIGNGIETLDQIWYSIAGFHLIYFPESVRKDCFTCVRLKGSAVANRADELEQTFTTEIPQIMADGGAKEFKRAKNQFNESSVLVPREPRDVD